MITKGKEYLQKTINKCGDDDSYGRKMKAEAENNLRQLGG